MILDKEIKIKIIEYPMQSEIIKNKSKKSSIEKFGVEYYSQSKDYLEKSKLKRISKGLQCQDISEFKRYTNKVISITSRNKNTVIENWNGEDYYDNNDIKENFSLDPNDKNYPTIDHKISVLYGFLNDISPDIIGSIDNLCITTRSNNSSKGEKIEINFKIKN